MTTPPPAPPEAAAAGVPDHRPSYHLRPLPAPATYALRHAVLWPDRPPAYVRLAADADGWHYGAFPRLPPPAAAAAAAAAGEAEEPVSVISLFLDDSLDAGADGDPPRTTTTTTTYYRFRKFATAAPWQGRGAGSALLRHVMALAAARQPEQPHGDEDDDDDGSCGGGDDDEVDGGRRGDKKKKSPGDGGVVIWCDARQSALPFYARFGFAAVGHVFYKGDVPYLQMSRRLV